MSDLQSVRDQIVGQDASTRNAHGEYVNPGVDRDLDGTLAMLVVGIDWWLQVVQSVAMKGSVGRSLACLPSGKVRIKIKIFRSLAVPDSRALLPARTTTTRRIIGRTLDTSASGTFAMGSDQRLDVCRVKSVSVSIATVA